MNNMGEKLLEKFKKTASESETKLIILLEKYQHPDQDDDLFFGIIFCTAYSGRENGWTNEFIRICEANPNATFDEVAKLIFTKERFPPLEIVEDDE